MLKCLNEKYYPYCKNLNMLIQIKDNQRYNYAKRFKHFIISTFKGSLKNEFYPLNNRRTNRLTKKI